jgi:hypothetical protein
MAAYGPQWGDQPPFPEGALVHIAARLTAIEQTLQEFQKLAWALFVLASRSPIQVERLDFRVDTVDVGELSGEMNIGLTHKWNISPGGESQTAPEPAPAGEPAGDQAETPGTVPLPSPAPPPPQPIWPPPT